MIRNTPPLNRSTSEPTTTQAERPLPMPDKPLRRRFCAGLLALSASPVPSTLNYLRGGEPNVPGTSDAQPDGRSPNDRRWAVATVHPLATQAAVDALQGGGNAFDAAVAACLMLGVVDSHNSGLGGGCFALIRTASGQQLAIDARETAPAAAVREMFLHHGQPHPTASREGSLASGVPGQLACLELLSQRWGTGRWKPALAAAAEVAGGGHAISPQLAAAITRSADGLRRYPASAAQFLAGERQPPAAGDWLIQADLARSLEMIGRHGSDWFYRGEFAQRLEGWMQAERGIMTAADLAGYQLQLRQPIETRYRHWRIIGFPPPSSGGVHIAQMLMMLEPYPLGELLAEQPAAAAHLITEVLRRAFADRARWLGDSDFVPVPYGLLSRDYCHRRIADFDPTQATQVVSAGEPPPVDGDWGPPRHTTHLSVADAGGNWVAITSTINTTFGSQVVVPGTGIVLNNQMDDFSIAPGIPNAFGLVGGEANAIEPGKRPLSSMSPTLVLDRDGRPRLSCGAAGGPRIISAVLQTLIQVLDAGRPVAEALAAPRLHHQWSPDQLVLERAWEPAIAMQLQSSGHRLRQPEGVGVAQAIERLPDGCFRASGDPRIAEATAAVG
jgi:gamma-glutamyltranspeptidase / glutathione hydrolase